MDKFSDMALFISIVKHQGLAAAGRELGLSPATVTARLQALEDRYGVKLLNRSTRHLSLTDSGALYHQACLGIIENVKETENLLQNGVKEVKGTLKIAAPKDIGKQYILPILSAFTDRYPDIVPYLYLNDNLSNIAESGIDVVIRYGDLTDSNLILRRLAPSRRVLCASPEYLARKGTPVKPQDLSHHDCLAMLRSNEELKTWHFQDQEGRNSVTVTPKRFSDDGEVIRCWALEGAGIALKSLLDVQNDINQQRLVTVLNGYMKNFNSSTTVSSADLNVVYISRQYQPKRLRLFLDFLFEQFEKQLEH
ncbi:LysR family transcriptional regulator [Shewanella sp. SW36]|jgi:DNA-binding transcriptional LysR family regulator|uniref:LysR family transcriptional regulator n=1 Tax=Shewanella TaxID=22 RepID=UPI00048C1AE3|nr:MULTISPECIES: LysR family transcriptional regulator [unclassified Shewanella]MBW3531351.1 LysR family transcriptional regulator [Shewanella sp. NKUCC06_TVS]MCU7961320.1 LysR family transcriptional regulator [Shewanella sp. SW32]MCU7969402.1 LysR family transcriptional regulator [Shewanella sp. SW29]MCU7974777.1 LysR family transcriptional regulator [Shewanella sp. SW36]MCU7990166.1 LysR family transcriptional regulator [Shewanella sp. SW1]